MRTPSDKFCEETKKLVRYWQAEFDLDHFTVVGVLLDVAVDVLFGEHDPFAFDDDDDDDDDEEDE